MDMSHLTTTVLLWSFCAALCRMLWVWRAVKRAGAGLRTQVSVQYSWGHYAVFFLVSAWAAWLADEPVPALFNLLAVGGFLRAVWPVCSKLSPFGAALVAPVVGGLQLSPRRDEPHLGDPEFDALGVLQGDVPVDWYLSARHRRAMVAFTQDGGWLGAEGAVMPVAPWSAVSQLRERAVAMVAFVQQMEGIDPLDWLIDEPDERVQRAVVLGRVEENSWDARRFAYELLKRAGVETHNEALFDVLAHQSPVLALAALRALSAPEHDAGSVIARLVRLERTDLEPLLTSVVLDLRQKPPALSDGEELGLDPETARSLQVVRSS